MDKISTWLWCDGTAEAMAAFYTGIFPDSRIVATTRGPADNPGGGKAGDVLTVEFTLAGRTFVCLEGGPAFTYNEAISLQVQCADQAEVDRYWDALSAHPENEQCGWLKDRFGLSWQIVPTRLAELLADPDRAKAKRAMDAMLAMKKIDIAAIERAAAGS